MQRVLRDAPRTLTVQIGDADGVGVTDITGATLVLTDAAGATTTVTASHDNTGAVTATLTAAQLGALGVYDVLWTVVRPGGTEHRRGQLEVVGAHLYDLAELRSLWDDYADAELWPAEKLRQNRDAVEDIFDTWCTPSLRRRGRTVVLDGTWHGSFNYAAALELPDLYVHQIVSASMDGVALTTPELAQLVVYDTGHLVRKTGLWNRGFGNITISYEHGLDQVPNDVHDQAMRLARATLTTPGAPDRATSISNDAGSFRLTIAGKDGPTGYPEIDACMMRWGAGNPLYVA